MSIQEEVIDATVTPSNDEEQSAIQLHNLAVIAASPIMPSDIEIVGTILDGGIRPIAASHLDIVGTLLGNRPITSSHLRISEIMPGNRPVFFDDIKLIDHVEMAGHRPILASDPALMGADMLLGNRPIFTNNIDDAPALMGYID
jgi:hypothetical protein